MRVDGFSPSVLFAALAGAAWLPFALLISPLLGTRGTLFYLAGIGTLYVWGLAPPGVTRLGVTLVVAVASLFMALTSGSLASAAVGLTAVLAVARSGSLFRSAPARTLLVEVALGSASLAVAGFLFNGSAPSLAFAIWGYFLTQSAFFLIRGVERPTRRVTDRDPFERASSDINAIIGDN